MSNVEKIQQICKQIIKKNNNEKIDEKMKYKFKIGKAKTKWEIIILSNFP